MKKLTANAHRAIASAKIDVREYETLVFLDGQLPRPVYEEVGEMFSRVGGKWKGNRKAHVFSYDPTLVFASVVKSGEMPEKNPLDFFPTPASVVDSLLEHTSIDVYPAGLRVLEPSAGTGALLKKIKAATAAAVDCIEIDPLKIADLSAIGAGKVYCQDFMTWEPEDGVEYEAVVMNPPFSFKGNTRLYIDHILRALDLVKKTRGVVAAIAPTGWLLGRTEKEVAFRNLVADCGEFEMLPANSFKESGTSVPTCIVILRAAFLDAKRPPFNDYRSYSSFQLFCTLENSIDGIEKLNRIKELVDADPDGARKMLCSALDALQTELISADTLISTSPESQNDAWLDLLDVISAERGEDGSVFSPDGGAVKSIFPA